MAATARPGRYRDPRDLLAVTFTYGAREADLLVPAHLPLGDYFTQVLDLLQPDDHDPATRTSDPSNGQGAGDPAEGAGTRDAEVAGEQSAWAVAPVGSPPLSWDTALEEVGVRDGDVLVVNPETRSLRGAAVHDIARESATEVDLLGDRFTSDWATTWWLSVIALAAGLAPAAMLAGYWVTPPVLAMLAVVALFATALPWVGLIERPRLMRGALVGVAALDLQVAAWQWAPDGAGRELLYAAAAAALVGAVASWRGTARAVGAALLVLAGAEALVGAGLAAGIDLQLLLVVVAVVCYLAVGIAPQVAISAGGLWGLQLLMRANGETERGTVAEAVEASTAVLTGLLAGLNAVAMVAAVGLAGGTRAALVLAGMVASGLLLRSQAFSRAEHVLACRWPIVAAAPFALTAAGLPLGEALAGVGLAALALLIWEHLPWQPHARSRGRLLAGWVETAVTVGMVPAACTAGGLFSWLGTRL